MAQVQHCDYETYEDAQKVISAMFAAHVPAVGVADSLGGEIVRAIGRIGYRYYNDGDIPGVGYGRETCNPAWRFLDAQVPVDVTNLYDAPESRYEDLLQQVTVEIANYLSNRPELFTEPLKGFEPDGYEAYYDPETDYDDGDGYYDYGEEDYDCDDEEW